MDGIEKAFDFGLSSGDTWHDREVKIESARKLIQLFIPRTLDLSRSDFEHCEKDGSKNTGDIDLDIVA
jgi:hypothetical protein